MATKRSRPAANGAATNELTTHNDIPYEPSSWMRQRLAVIIAATTPLPDAVVTVTPLGLTWSEPESREDYRCDRCGTHVPDGLIPFGYSPQPRLLVVGGLCQPCADREVPR